MKTVINRAIIFIFSLIAIGCLNKPPKLNCKISLEEYKLELKSKFKADSVKIRSITLKEEIYFPTLIAPKISIYNPETESLNFKLLDSEKYTRFDNFQEIENNLKKEAQPIAQKISQNCDLSEFNDILVEFAKSANHDKIRYSFISHF